MASEVFGYTGAAEWFAVPGGVEEIEVLLRGASGGDGGWLPVTQPRSHVENWTVLTSPNVPIGESGVIRATFLPGTLAFLWVRTRWTVGSAASTVAVSSGWSHVASTPVASNATHSVQGHLYSRVLTESDLTSTVTVTATSGSGRSATAGLQGILPFVDAGEAVVSVQVDAVSGVSSWTPSVVGLGSGRHHRLAWVSTTRTTAFTMSDFGSSLSSTANAPATASAYLLREAGDPVGPTPSVSLSTADAAVCCSINVSTPLPLMSSGGQGGRGGLVVAKVPVTAGDVVTVEVGGKGVNSGAPFPDTGINGSFGAGSGGGQTRVAVNGTTVAVAGAGGGAGGILACGSVGPKPDGGDGGMVGQAGATPSPPAGFIYGLPGTGATGTTAGTGGSQRTVFNSASQGGTSQRAGAAVTPGGGGGGGGRMYGGGGGSGWPGNTSATPAQQHQCQGGGGGGGSSWVNTAAGVVLVDHFTGDNVGDGEALIEWAENGGWSVGLRFNRGGWASN